MKKCVMVGMCMVMASLVARGVLAGDDVTSETSLNLGVTWTEGNSDTLRANAGIEYQGRREAFGAIRAGAEGNYGYSRVDGEKDRDVENASAFFNARKTLTERTFASLNSTFLYDGQANIDYRFIVGPNLGTVLLKNENTELSVEIGPSYLWEEVDGRTDDFLVVRFAQRLDHRLSETARIWQEAEYLPKSEDFNDYLLHAEAGISASLTDRTSLRVVLQSRYDSTPASGKERHDITVITGITLTL